MAYATGFIFMGRLMDRLGTRRGFSLSVVFWSLAAMAHSLAYSVTTFSLARFGLGIGEGKEQLITERARQFLQIVSEARQV